MYIYYYNIIYMIWKLINIIIIDILKLYDKLKYTNTKTIYVIYYIWYILYIV